VEFQNIPRQFLDQLEIGISIVTWRPLDSGEIEWLFINEARCRMTGFTREEILAKKPMAQATRESRALVQKTNEVIEKHGSFTCESTLLHRSNRAVPVLFHMKRVRWEDEDALMTEIHDITSFKETESQLLLSRQSAREMLSMLEKEKKSIIENVQSNLGLVLYPLMDQLRVTANDQQKEVLDLMTSRIGHFCREVGISGQVASPELNLTRRQILICEMIRDGMATKEIARALGCSPSTINNHRNAIRKKLKLSGKAANLQAYLNSIPGEDS